MRSIEDQILITEREEEEQIEELQLDDLGEEILWSIVAFLPRRLDYRAVCPNWSDVLDFRPYGRRDLGAPKPPSELCFEFDTVWSKYVFASILIQITHNTKWIFWIGFLRGYVVIQTTSLQFPGLSPPNHLTSCGDWCGKFLKEIPLRAILLMEKQF